MKCIYTNILTPRDGGEVVYLPEHYLWMWKGKICAVAKDKDLLPYNEFEDMSGCLCVPGFIDAHVHLSQYHIRGKYAPDLLSWLKKYTYPAEYLSHNSDYAYKIAEEFYRACIKKGTTTTVVYTAPFAEACEAALETADKLGVRSIVGMTLMDRNTPEELLQTTDYALQESNKLWEKWNDRELLDYIYTPRFAITCSGDLMQEIGRLVQTKKVRVQSHLSENQQEIANVLEMFPQYKSYTEVYADFGLLSGRTIMGHGIHLSDREMEILKESDTGIAFCPDSNLFLKSGQIKWSALQEKGIRLGLASDVGGGTDLSMLKIMKFADYILDKAWLNPQKAFYYGTLGNAELLGIAEQTGSVEEGKEADLVYIRLNENEMQAQDMDEILSRLVYLNHEVEIERVLIKGKELYNKDKSGGNDEVSRMRS